jgi:beta-N-acetylhexosaminidase
MDDMIGIAERLPTMSDAARERLDRALRVTGNVSDADRHELIAKRDSLLELAGDLA